MAIEGVSFPASSTLSVNTESRSASAGAEQRELRQAVRTVQNAGYGGEANELNITFDSNTRRSVVQIVDRETKEVLSQIPSKDILELAKYYKSLESGKG